MSSLSLHNAANKKKKIVNVILLNGEAYQVTVDVKSKFLDVFNQITSYLNLRETEYFGLAQKKDEEYLFVALDEKIHRQAPKSWKSGNGEGLDERGQPILTVHFRVHFYVDQFVLLREKVTRHLYYLQLKENLLSYNHVCSEGKCFQMVSYALQADFGNYNSDKHGEGYFDPREYFPAWMVKRRGENYIVNNTPVIHQDLQNVTKSEAELRFIREASMSPAAHNLHFYRLRKRKTDKTCNAWLGVCAKGIELYEEIDDSFKNLISTFLWPDIGKLHFEKKKFEIQSGPGGRKFAYYTDSDSKSKYLLSLCRTTHMFQMAIQPKLMEIRHLDAEDKRRYRESYIYSDTQDLVTNGGAFRGNLSPSSKGTTTRFSVVSDASSNTTSGIASDKMTISFEESDDHNKEIIIDCPPQVSSFRMSPRQGRLKADGVISTLPSYVPSRSKKTSPKLDYKSASVGRGIKRVDHSPSLGRPTLPPSTSPIIRHIDRISPTATPVIGAHRSDISAHSGHSTHSVQSSSTMFNSSEHMNKSPSGSSLGSLQGGRLSLPCPPQSVPPTYNSARTVPVYVAHTTTSSFSHSDAISFSQPVSRSTSRADSFNKNFGRYQLQENEPFVPPISNQLQTTFPSTLAPCSGCGTSVLDALAGNLVLSSYPPVTQGVMTEVSYTKPEMTESYIPNSEMTLPEMTKEYLAPPPMFADLSHNESTDSALSGSSNLDPKLSGTSESGSVDYVESDLEEVKQENEPKNENPPTQISVNNQEEILHPELEEIRGQPSAFSSFSMITKLCNDKSLMQTPYPKVTVPMIGAYDMSSMRSTDSRISHLSHELDSRRLSSCYPESSQAMVTPVTPTRPYSWHSENFDLDSQLTLMNGNVAMMPGYFDNHSSMPHALGGILVAPSSLANSVALDFARQQMIGDRYSPQSIASHLMIPSKLSSGGHSTTDRNISQKAFKETYGIA
ncbi:protein expanded-like [Saccostrea echinata]|uniref:protein expanded-like n=1 Tax=Saccostrea echinata TaxID=191078 RepID=UPI002A819BD3|nr:protein expanded-like [Saccostrea echinata]XP_061173034.1 protein expanded-like [Saccostrea echinata]